VNAHPFSPGHIGGGDRGASDARTSDDWGHGTRVSGVAIFGDLAAQLEAGMLNRGSRLCSAKVVNENGSFDDRRLVPSQMREAITTLNARFGAAFFVVSLGERKRTYDGGKVGSWAATLDELARELDIVIVVSVWQWKATLGQSPRTGRYRIIHAISWTTPTASSNRRAR